MGVLGFGLEFQDLFTGSIGGELNQTGEHGMTSDTLKFLSLDKLRKIKNNNYMRLSSPFGRHDPEQVDREIRKKVNRSRELAKKYKNKIRG